MNFVQIEGAVIGVFAHRFVIEGDHGKMLIDIGPDANLPIAEGDRISAEGYRKPSEMKVSLITLADSSVHQFAHGKKGRADDKYPGADAIQPEAALEAARSAGYTIDGTIQRKPKHFEVPGRKGGDLFVLHIALDGAIKKAEPANLEA